MKDKIGIPFFIAEVPAGAEYCRQHNFCDYYKGEDGVDYNRILKELQIVDPRILPEELDEIESTPIRSELAALFEIKDMQLSPQSGEAICGVSIYNEENEAETIDKPFEVYLSGLEELIARFRHQYQGQKLRVYVGDATWDTLHREKILENKHVDFVRMAASSRKSEVGHLWRLMVYDNFDYQFAYCEDADSHDGSRWFTDLEMLKKRVLWDTEYPVNFGATLLFSPRIRPLRLLKFFVLSNTSCKHSRFIEPLAAFCRNGIRTTTRGPRELPFKSIVPILCHLLGKTESLVLYHPQTHRWTTYHDLSTFSFHAMDDYWLMPLTKVLNIHFWLSGRKAALLQEIFEFNGINYFLGRLFRQLRREGNYISLQCGKAYDILMNDELLLRRHLISGQQEVQ